MGSRRTILLLNTDGIGPETTAEARKVLETTARKYGHRFEFVSAPFGYRAFKEKGHVFPEDVKSLVKKVIADGGAVMKGPVGLGKKESAEMRAAGIHLENDTVIEMRRMLDAYMAFRPAILPLELHDLSPLKPERLGQGINIMMLRELTGGIYFGKKMRGASTNWAFAADDCKYTETQVVRFAHACFRHARERKTNLTMVQKPNVLATGEFWEHHFGEIAPQYPDVKYNTGIVDSVDANLTLNPTQYNGTMGLEQLQGDILTDSILGSVGSLGFGAASCWNPETNMGFFEPTHGSAPTIAGKNIANPYSMIGSAAFLLEQAFGMKEESIDVWASMNRVFAEGYMTSELVFNLDEKQKEQRVARYVNEFLPLHKSINREINAQNLTALVRNHYAARDICREQRVVSTSQFGDLVAQRISEAKA